MIITSSPASGVHVRAAGAGTVDLDHDCVVQQAVEERGGDHVVAEHVTPVTEAAVAAVETPVGGVADDGGPGAAVTVAWLEGLCSVIASCSMMRLSYTRAWNSP